MKFLRTFWSQLRSPGRQRAEKQKIDDELRAHLERRIAENIAAGMTPEDAARAARKRFGNFQSVREDCRDLRGANFGETLLQDVRFGARLLWRNPAFTLTVLLTVGLAIGATAVIYSFVYAIVLRSLPYDSPDRIVIVGGYTKSTGDYFRGMALLDFLDMRAQTHAFMRTAYFRPYLYNFSGAGEPKRVSVTRVSPEFIDVFGARPALGRNFAPEEDAPGAGGVALLGYGFWKREFGGDTNALGKEILLDGRKIVVIGVMPEQFAYPPGTELWMPVAAEPRFFAPGAAGRKDERHTVVARLAPGVSFAQAQAEMTALADHLEKQFPDSNVDRGLRLVGIHEQLIRYIRPILFILFSAVAIVLLTACANVANLLLARAVAREKEMTIRCALGAARSRIVRQLLTESVMLAVCAGGLGLGLACGGVRFVRWLAPAWIPMLSDVGLNVPVVIFTFGVSVLTGVLFGIVPAFHSYAKDLTEALKGRGTGGTRRNLARNTLVILEVSLSVVLLTGAALLLKSFVRLQNVEVGFETEKVVAIQLHPPQGEYDRVRKYKFYEQLEDRVAEATGGPACISRFVPMSGQGIGLTFYLANFKPASPRDYPSALSNVVSSNYFRILGLPLLRGRTFSRADSRDAPAAVVINESFARRWFPNQDPLGQGVWLQSYSSNKMHTVVGLVADARYWGPGWPPEPGVYVNYDQGNIGDDTALLMRTGLSPVRAEKVVRDALRDLDPNIPVGGAMTIREIRNHSMATPRFNTLLLGSMALLALVLAAGGIYGVLAYSVTQRTNEIGVRMALGARRSHVLWLVLQHGLKLALAGIGIGVIAAFALTRVIATWLYDVKPTDPLTFAAVPLFLLFVALFACWLPARRATKVDPMVALRYE